jgi:glycerol-3-phosphate dehydrogenase
MTHREPDSTAGHRRQEPVSLPGIVDLLVIGAGINGTAIARDAALRGLDVALVEREDFAVGASAWNSRMIHGGIRYLEHGELRLVYESLSERGLLLRQAPHLVQPYPLMIPYYRHNDRPGWIFTLGMFLYDLLSLGKSTPWSRVLSLSRTREEWPGLNAGGLRGGGLYYDAQVVWPERLSVENAIAAAQSGAHVYTHVAATRLLEERGRVIGAHVVDELSGVESHITARAVINATGANIDAMIPDGWRSPRLIGGTKGTHLLVDPFPGAPPTAIHYEAVSDARALLVLPWNGRYLLGTTDEFVEGDPASVRTDREEIEYLLAETNRLIPAAGLAIDDVIWSYVGVRPLPFVKKAKTSADVSRDHLIHDHGPEHAGLWSIIGGKLTTHRALAEQTLRAVSRFLGVRVKGRRSITRSLALPGGNTSNWKGFRENYLASSSFGAEQSLRLLNLYGTRVRVLEDLAARRPELRTEICGIVGAEIANAFENEFARTVSDVLLRRTMAAFAGLDQETIGRAVATAAARFGYLASDDIEDQTADYLRSVDVFLPARGGEVKPDEPVLDDSDAPAESVEGR